MHIHPDLVFFGILLLVLLWLTARIIYCRAKGRPLHSRWTRAVKYLGQIALAIGVLLQAIELTIALDQVPESVSIKEFAQGLRTTFFSTVHGLMIYTTAMVLFLILILTEKKEAR